MGIVFYKYTLTGFSHQKAATHLNLLSFAGLHVFIPALEMKEKAEPGSMFQGLGLFRHGFFLFCADLPTLRPPR